jgi:hypothetical protein
MEWPYRAMVVVNVAVAVVAAVMALWFLYF